MEKENEEETEMVDVGLKKRERSKEMMTVVLL